MENKSTCHMTNEKRLIDANERIKWLEDNTTEEEWLVNQYNADWIYSMLEHAPTVDAVEVIYGQNIVNEDDEWYGQVNQCSICGCNWMMYDEDDLHCCPKCCAKLAGGNEDV